MSHQVESRETFKTIEESKEIGQPKKKKKKKRDTQSIKQASDSTGGLGLAANLVILMVMRQNRWASQDYDRERDSLKSRKNRPSSRLTFFVWPGTARGENLDQVVME